MHIQYIYMKYTIVAPIGDNSDALFAGIREFPTERIVLIVPKKYSAEAGRVEKELVKFRIPVRSVPIEGSWESVFKTIVEMKNTSNNILVNVSTGSRDMQCAATSAAFVSGLKAFSVDNDNVFMLPVMKFSYYKAIPEKKMSVLKLLKKDRECCASLEELSKKLKMSLPLVSYHINGNAKSEGLIDMGLVSVVEKKGRMNVNLTPLGNLLAEGYIDTVDNK